ncbi:hypothetical protein [Alienimonas sp. DA493]|uniref:hypothetical protein n=1 Tax=Alienimonas sp. DA493 TaxID=3373605 RepID=UPI003754A3D6
MSASVLAPVLLIPFAVALPGPPCDGDCPVGAIGEPAIVREAPARPHYLAGELTLWTNAWCLPCKEVKPLAMKAGVRILDVDLNPEAAAKNGVYRVPRLDTPDGRFYGPEDITKELEKVKQTAPTGVSASQGTGGGIPFFLPGKGVVKTRSETPAPAGPVILYRGRAVSPRCVGRACR